MTKTKSGAERGTKPLEPREVEKLRLWIAADTEAVVVEQVGVSRLSIARLLAGLDVHAGTRLAARSALARRGA